MTLSRIAISLCLGAASLALTVPAFAQETETQPAPAAEAGPMDARLRALYEAETEWRHQEFHLVKRDDRWVQGDRFASETAEAQASRLAYWRDVLRQLDAIPVDQLSAEEQVNAAVFRQMIWEQVNSLEYKTYEAPFNSVEAICGWAASLGYKGVQIAAWDGRLIDLAKAAESKTYCGLCSRLRRGSLYTYAKSIGVTKIALGHHRDDIIETLFLNMFFGGKLKAMPPKLLSDDGQNVIIRPLAYCKEKEIERYAALREFPIIPCNLCGSQDNLQRVAIKQMLQQWEKQHPGRLETIFRSICNVSLSHLADTSQYPFKELRTLAASHQRLDVVELF